MQTVTKRALAHRKNAKGRVKHATKAALDFANQPLPKSLEWVYGFGFKVGVFLIIKSFLALRFLDLSFSGVFIVVSQLIMAFVFIILGLIMQRPGSLFDRPTLRISTLGYGAVGISSTIVCIIKANFNLDFFREVTQTNWFIDFFAGLSKGFGELSLSIIFWDIDLWTMFCFILLVLTIVSSKIAFPTEKNVSSKSTEDTSLIA